MTDNQTLVDTLGWRDDTQALQLLGETGFLWSYLGRWQEAQCVFDALTRLIPNDPVGYLGLAEVSLMQNQYAEAHKHAQQASKAAITRPAPNDVDRATAARGYVISAKALMHQDDTKGAADAFMKAVELDPSGVSGQHAADMLKSAELIGLATS